MKRHEKQNDRRGGFGSGQWFGVRSNKNSCLTMRTSSHIVMTYENKLLAGTIKACESIAQCTVDLREEIKNFGKMVGNTESNSTYPSDNLSHPLSDEEANKTGVFIEAILRGIPVKQAEQEAADAEEKKILYSAISMGPEE